MIRFLRRLLCWLFCSKNKKKIYARLIRENVMGLIYEVVLPEADIDVVARHLKFHVNGVVSTFTVGANEKTFVLPPVDEGVNITITLQDEDDAGNLSDESAPYTFDTKDTIKPKMPGIVAVNLLEEVASTTVGEIVEPVVEVVETPEDPAPEPASEDTVDLPPDHEVKFL